MLRASQHVIERRGACGKRDRGFRHWISWPLAAVLVGLSVAPAAIAGTGIGLWGYGSGRNPSMVVAAAEKKPAVRLVVSGPFEADAGGNAVLPLRVEPQGSLKNEYVMLRRVPEWLTPTAGESMGSGVWLLQSDQLDKVQMAVAKTATGKQDIVVSLLSKDGSVASEVTLSLQVRSAPSAETGAQLTAARKDAPPTPPAEQGKRAYGAIKPIPPPDAVASPAAAASEKVAQAPAQAKGGGGAQKPKDEAQLIAYARHLVKECTTCHSLYGQDVGIPVMVGLKKERFLDTMQLYRDGKRDNAVMQSVAQALDDEQSLALALYLGRIKPAPQGETRAAAVPVPKEVPTNKALTPEQSKRIKKWLGDARQFIDTGDIAQARLLLTRAVRFGDPQAALMLGNTYDPNVLPWQPAFGLQAEPLKARDWYVFAQKLGAGQEAADRLLQLR